jgi:hypothetical protein
MSTVTKARQRVKPARSVRLLVGPGDDGKGGVVRIAVGKVAADYLLDMIPADFGRGFRLAKAGEETAYHVNLSADGRLCDCPGHSRWGHCKHADGLAALTTASRL